MVKCQEQGISYYEGLRSLRNTPISSDLPSPAQLLQGRTLPDSIPRQTNMLFPQTYDRNIVRNKLETLISKAKVNYDKTASQRPLTLLVNQSVKVKLGDKWHSATVDRPADEPRSYWIKTNRGQILRRNITDLVPFTYSHTDEPDTYDDDSYWPRANHATSNHSSSTSHSSQSAHNTNTPSYRTRSGRKVNKPERWGFDA